MSDLTASEVSVGAVGEVVEADVQAQLVAFDRSTANNERLDDLQIALALVDDFVGGSAQSGMIGKLGWSSAASAGGAAGPGIGYAEPGVIEVQTGTAGSALLGLGTKNLNGSPVFLCEMRLKLLALNNPSDGHSSWVGLHNGTAGVAPGVGFFFRYTQSKSTWEAVCSNGATQQLAIDTNIGADTAFHRFRITCDGTGIVRFYVDVPDGGTGVPVATITNDPAHAYLPNFLLRYAPAFLVTKTSGSSASRGLAVDYFALRYEWPR